MPTNNPILTIDFFEKLESFTLQYHPSSLDMSDRSQTRSQPGLDSIITFAAPKDTSENRINISTYLTALIPQRDGSGLSSALRTDLIAGAAIVSAAVSATAAGTRTILDSFDAAASTMSLAKGVYNISTGLVSNFVLNPSPIGLPQDHIRKLQTIAQAIDESIPCLVVWDLALDVFPNNEYVITGMNIAVEDIQEETGTSMIIKVDLDLIKHGTRIEVL